ncbi:hypothetical protein L2E82_25427 [Cichorium intybus]|uniref:Uncharacterized protein n=1 Tax=Cichorium intybus TaxID=13427 RepID=A0ACB9E3F7_CICIN|nr:hypothetical protein L2E82_25427 [Cichorium intybus]
MENLPESFYVDPRGASSSNSAPQNTARRQAFSAADRAEIQRLINLLNQPQTRADAIAQLNRVYKLNKCMASHPEARLELIKAQIPTYISPFLNTTEKQLVQYDYLRLNSLGIIGALLKEECPQTAEIVHYLLQCEMVPLCLRCMEMGSDLTKSVAALVLGKILEQQEGKTYCGTFAERFFSVSRALSKMVDEFSGKPPPSLLKNTLICYLRLSEISRCCDVLKDRYPQRLKNPAYLHHVCDGNTRALAEHVLQNIMTGQQVQPMPARTVASAMR